MKSEEEAFVRSIVRTIQAEKTLVEPIEVDAIIRYGTGEITKDQLYQFFHERSIILIDPQRRPV